MGALSIPQDLVPLSRCAARLRVNSADLRRLHDRGDFPVIRQDSRGRDAVDSLDFMQWFRGRILDPDNRPDLRRSKRTADGKPMTP